MGSWLFFFTIERDYAIRFFDRGNYLTLLVNVGAGERKNVAADESVAIDPSCLLLTR